MGVQSCSPQRGVCGLKQIKRGKRAEDTCAGTPRLRGGSDGWVQGLRLPALRQEGHLSDRDTDFSKWLC